MNIEQLEKGKELQKEIERLKRKIKIWEDAIQAKVSPVYCGREYESETFTTSFEGYSEFRKSFILLLKSKLQKKEHEFKIL